MTDYELLEIAEQLGAIRAASYTEHVREFLTITADVKGEDLARLANLCDELNEVANTRAYMVRITRCCEINNNAPEELAGYLAAGIIDDYPDDAKE